MLKPHLEYFVDQIRDVSRTAIEHGSKVSDQVDKIVVWIVGFATGAIALLISQGEKLSQYNLSDIKWLVGFLTLSVITGILGRVIYAISSYLSVRVYLTLESKLLATKFPYKPRILEGTEKAETVLKFFKEDFGMDLPILSNMALFVEPQHTELYHESVRKYYGDVSKWSESQTENAKIITEDIFQKTFGYSDKKMKKQTEGEGAKPRLMRFTYRSSVVLYLTSLIAFAIAVISFSIAFITFVPVP